MSSCFFFFFFLYLAPVQHPLCTSLLYFKLYGYNKHMLLCRCLCKSGWRSSTAGWSYILHTHTHTLLCLTASEDIFTFCIFLETKLHFFLVSNIQLKTINTTRGSRLFFICTTHCTSYCQLVTEGSPRGHQKQKNVKWNSNNKDIFSIYSEKAELCCVFSDVCPS